MATTPTTDDLRARVAEVLPGIRRDLEDLVRIESVSADPERTAELFAAEGVTVEIVRAYDGAPPAVIGEKQGPAGAPPSALTISTVSNLSARNSSATASALR